MFSCGREEKLAAPIQRTEPSAKVQPVVPQTALPPPPSPAVDPVPETQTIKIVERINFGAKHSNPDEIAAFARKVNSLSSNEAAQVMRKLMADRTPEGANEMMRLLSEFEMLIPNVLPPQNEVDTMEKAINLGQKKLPLDHWKVSFRKAVELSVTLVMYGYPTATERAELFRKRLHNKWDNVPQAKIYLNSMDWEFRHAYQSLKEGTAPWQERVFSKP
jgi:hypothetical protein